MNRQQLLETINRLRKEENIPESILRDDGFIDLQEYRYLREEFVRNKIKGEKWHQIVRFALSDPNERKYMYDRLLELLLVYRRSHTDYFELKSEIASILLPDRFSYLNRLTLLHKEYFEIYKSIINKIHFDYPSEIATGPLIKGRVNWSRVSRRSPTTFPIIFDIWEWIREFDTPENILLVLPAFWLGRESHRMLVLPFIESLNRLEVTMLNTLLTNTQEIRKSFPFHEVIDEARKFANLSVSDERVLRIESESLDRINDGQIKERYDYLRLLKWIRKFRELNIRMVSNTLTNFPLDTLANLDTIYEAWIFFEIMNVVEQRYGLRDLQMKETPYYFEFEFKSHKLKFFYEREFELGGRHAWAVTCKPDFIVMEGEKIIAIFDAKNYGVDGKTEAKNKMLAYLTNLDCNFGALFFPEFDHEAFVYPSKSASARFHFDLKLAHYKIQPKNSEDAITTTKDMISDLLDEITRRLGSSHEAVVKSTQSSKI